MLISPKNGNFTNCFSEDPLPEGLILDSLSCYVSGIPSSLVSNLTVNIVSNDSAYGSFLLTITRCNSNSFEILRTYGQSNVYFEIFTIQDADTGETLVNVTAGTPKKAGSAVSYRFCRSTQSLSIVLASTVYPDWYVGSKLEVFYLLPVQHQKDLLLRCRMDTLAGMPTTFRVDVSYAFNRLSTWKYHFDSLPVNWETSKEVAWPEGTMDSFPSSTNQIQLYKLGFLYHNHVSGTYELSLHYQYGCVVFLNGNEVFRDHLPYGDLSNTTVATGSSSLRYNSIILPTVQKESGEWHSVFVRGRNVITVGLFGPDFSGFQSHFDGSLRFTGEVSQYRSFDMVGEIGGLQSNDNNQRDAGSNWHDTAISSHTGGSAVVDVNHETWVTMSGPCNDSAYILLRFNSSRRETLSRITLTSYFHDPIPGPAGFSLYGRTEDSEPWEFITSLANILWTSKAQTQQFWIHSTKAFNSFRFSSFRGTNGTCDWRLAEIILYTEKYDRSIQPLSFAPLNTYTHMILQPIFPSSSDYFNFHMRPNLPSSLQMDSLSGCINGRFISTLGRKTYSIIAYSFTGDRVVVEWNVTVSDCAFEHSFYTVRALIPDHLEPTYWELHQGESIDDPLIFDSGSLPSGTNEWTFCLDDDFYTFFFVETSGSGWNSPSGFTIATAIDSFPFITGTLPRRAPRETWSNTTVTLWSHQPIQPRTSIWHMFTHEPKASWTSISYNDHDWEAHTTDAIALLPIHSPTLYLRRRFVIEELTMFSILDMQMWFSGGICVYFNGYPVFQMNLPVNFTSSSYATKDHLLTKPTRFSILLRTVDAKDGENVIAVELHRNETSHQVRDFDCILQPILDYFSPITQSYDSLSSSKPYFGTVDNLFDFQAPTIFRPVFQIGTFFQWELENEIQGFNRYGILAANAVMNHTWSLSGRFSGEHEWIPLDIQVNQTFPDRSVVSFELPQAMAGFREYRFEVIGDVNVSVYAMMELFLIYESPLPDQYCPSDIRYRAVAYGDTSYAHCPYGYKGLASRECIAGEWEPENLMNCSLLPPYNFHYSVAGIRIPSHYSMTPVHPSVEGLVNHFTVSPPLPPGMVLLEDGTITGEAVTSAPVRLYQVTAVNSAGSTSTTLLITVYDRYCPMTSLCPKSLVGETCRVPCQLELKDTVGIRTKTCIAVDLEHGEWSSSKGQCGPVGIVIGIAFCIIAVLIFMLIACASYIAKKRNTVKKRIVFATELKNS